MNILYVFGFPMRIAGGLVSALAVMKYLRRAGHRITIAAPSATESMLGLLSRLDVDYRAFAAPAGRGYLWSGARRLAEAARDISADILHALEYRSLARTYRAALLARKGCVYTDPGGCFVHHNPPRAIDTILFSREQMDVFHRRFALREENTHLIMARIDMEVYRPAPVPPLFVERFNLPGNGKKMVMAMRLDRYKAPFLKSFMAMARALLMECPDVHILVAGDGVYYDELVERAAHLNREAKSNSSLRFIGPLLDTNDVAAFMNYGDIVLGSGRAMLEGMACGKPAVVLGECNTAQVVACENIESIAYANFSGRHLRDCPKDKADLRTNVSRLLDMSNSELRHLAEFSQSFIAEHMDARQGARQFERVYARALTRPLARRDYCRWYATACLAKLCSVKNELQQRIRAQQAAKNW